MVIGYDKELHNFSESECKNIISYIKTKFFRYMVSVKKKTQNTTRDLFQFVPIQDFSDKSDIDWTKDVDNINTQLYLKYNLGIFEQEYIESLIKSME